ncbi:hypothetical protein CCAX7_19100 [Capsulimonas corticalis]|uniref:Uncharacterized protein n=1 Tax=Capsulimonas corticalis TaxID=2219043 RepID=A0A402D5E8_9BACT|nr:AraC family transcriptional regulator [Capsulimonas corticalis]BDI29859.1 hypothetical protein CCAX7_19100 [Capsulimonas corticalis]
MFWYSEQNEVARPVVTQTLIADERETPLGQIRSAGYIKDSPGVSLRRKRVLGRYAIVLLLEGSGVYEDIGGTAREVTPGDALLLFPELAHGYGPRAGERWSELFVVFDGAAFDRLRESALFSSAHPVIRAGLAWRGALEAVTQTPATPPHAARTVQTSRFLSVLTEMLATVPIEEEQNSDPAWLRTARQMLSTNLSVPLTPEEISRSAGLSYETFRKRFEAREGVAPARYRMNRRIDAACSLLRYTRMPIRQIAESLGFSDEFHLSNKFRQKMGVRPSQYRVQYAPDGQDSP